MKVYIHTFGCRTNQYDSALIAQELESRGFGMCGSMESADWVAVNTCAVTRRGEDKACQWIRKAHRENPRARIAVLGCSVEASRDRFAALDGVCLLLGTEEKYTLAEVLADGADRGKTISGSGTGAVGSISAYSDRDILHSHRERARAHVKVQDGCDNSCAYCIVPRVRGRSRSRPLESVLREVRALEDAGHGELVLTGIHIGRYGADLDGGPGLSGLVERIMEATERIRVRLSSIEATEVDDCLLELMADPAGRLCNHLHLPLQHGTDEILSAMNRWYTVADYRRKVERVIEKVGCAGLGSDLIAGFPGEDERLFERNLALVESLPFTYLHVFPFSPRPGTAAQSMAGHGPSGPELRSRVRRLRELSAARRDSFLGSLRGRSLRVLPERRLADGLTACRARNYSRVFCRLGQERAGEFQVVAGEPYRDGVRGKEIKC